MSRLKQTFALLRGQNRCALIPFITAGDPKTSVTVPLMHAMVDAGANIIELGVPFSDPMADGPVIQQASERALLHHTSVTDVLEMVRHFREKDAQTPVVLMGYLNPIEISGYEKFAHAAAEAGVDGVLTVDLPPEEAEEFTAIMRQKDIDTIFLLAPTSTTERIEKICSVSSGFVYYVSVKGVTGSSSLDITAVTAKLNAIRLHTELPVGVGFGIKDAVTAKLMAATADAVIIGSALVSRIAANQDNPAAILSEVTELLAAIRKAIDE